MARFVRLLPVLCSMHVLAGSAHSQQPARSSAAATAPGRVVAIGNLTYTEVDALDRNKTLFLLPVGILEEHGPHLAIAADLVGVDYEAGQLAKRLSRALPGWNVVLMPTVSYGATGANHLNGLPIHPGTYAIR